MSVHKQPPSTEPASGYRLHPPQVPDCPAGGDWVDHLRWCVAVMDADDDDLGFAASLLSYAVSKGGLTSKQARHGNRLLERIHALWLADALDCQRSNTTAPVASHSLSDMDTKGSA